MIIMEVTKMNKLDRITIGESDFSPYDEINYDEHLVWINTSLRGSDNLKSEIQQAIEKAEHYHHLTSKLSTESRENVVNEIKIEELQQQIKQLQEENKGLLKVMETYDDRDNRDIVELKHETQHLKDDLQNKIVEIGVLKEENKKLLFQLQDEALFGMKQVEDNSKLKEKLEIFRNWTKTNASSVNIPMDKLKQILGEKDDSG